jgi:hypothetical protein
MARKTQSGSPRAKLSSDFLEAFQQDFAKHGAEVIAKMRLESPSKYAELAGRLIAASDPPEGGSLKDCNSMTEIARRLLKSIGVDEPDEAAIQAAVEANDVFVKRLEAIAQASGVSPGTIN